jgi:hypothetical protein
MMLLKSSVPRLIVVGLASVILLLSNLRPDKIWWYHFSNTKTSYFYVPNRMEKVHNTEVYKQLNNFVDQDVIVINLPGQAHSEAMFFSNRNCYHYYPEEKEFMAKLKQGFEFAYFKNQNNVIPPSYIRDNAQEIPLNLYNDKSKSQ